MTAPASKPAVSFQLDIEPLPCPRPRIATRGKFAHAYYPKAYQTWKDQAQEAVHEAITGLGIGFDELPESDVYLDVEFVCTRPKTTKLSRPKPDIDNYQKSLMDAATQAGLWSDDSKVAAVTAIKRWARPGESAGIRVSLTALEAD